MKVLFACTSLHKDSTLITEYDYISTQLKTYIPYYNESAKEVFILYKTEFINSANIITPKNGLSVLANNYINLPQLKILNINIVDFTQKVDILVLTQCSNLIQTFVNNLSSKTDIYEVITNVIKMYNLIEDNGYIVNFYYTLDERNQIILSDVEDFYSESSITFFLFHIYLLVAFNILFKKIACGVYKKNFISNVEDVLISTYNELYNTLKSLKKDIGVDSTAKIIIETYFKQYYTRDTIVSRLKKRLNTVLKSNS